MKLLRTLPLLLFWLCHVGNSALGAGDPPVSPGLKRARLHVVGSETLFGMVNRGDAIAAMSIRTEQIGRIRGFRFESKMEIAQSIGQMRQDLTEHSVDLLVLDTPDYLSLDDARLVEAVAAGTIRGGSGVHGRAAGRSGRKGGPVDVFREDVNRVVGARHG